MSSSGWFKGKLAVPRERADGDIGPYMDHSLQKLISLGAAFLSLTTPHRSSIIDLYPREFENERRMLMNRKRTFPALLLAAALFLGLLAAPVSAANTPSYNVDTTVTDELNSRKTQAAKGFAIASGVLQGDAAGELHWERTLTRAQAATMIIRLMGLEDQAKAAMSQPSSFTDVPAWANGYVNVAYQEQIVKGVSDDRFAPNSPCRVQDFITMLYRLTNLTENQDFSWGTALTDLVRDTKAIAASYQGRNNWTNSVDFRVQASMLENYFKNGGAFTREAACDVIYFMLNIKAGPDDESLGDLLSANCGMSDLLLFHHYVRRTAYTLKGVAVDSSTLTFEKFTGSTPTVVSIKDGKLYVEDSLKSEITVTFPTDAMPFGETFSCAGPVALPKQTVTVSMNYNERFLAGYDEDGDPVYGAYNHNKKFTVSYKNGAWSLSDGDASRQDNIDYAYYYAYRCEDHFASLAKVQGNLEITPEIQALADKLTAGKATELDKADAICEWVATHIYYDYDSLHNASTDDLIHRQQPGAVLERRRAICDGYSKLTLVLMQAAGLECYEEAGKGNSASHGWNVARLDGKWVVIDNTWDSPLTYEKNAGEGYQCRYSDPDLIWVWRTPSDIMEPGASRRQEKVYFNMSYDEFYSSHKILHAPQFANRTTTNIDYIT